MSQPKLLDELELRAGPLREQWEGRGPGLLAGICRLTEPGILVERADVLVVYPVAGGGGTAHREHNAVSIEAVLANPLPQLPEVARLAWLIAQLNLDLPRYTETLRGSRRVAALATIPPTLAAAADVELVQDDRATLGLGACGPGGLAATMNRPWPIASTAGGKPGRNHAPAGRRPWPHWNKCLPRCKLMAVATEQSDEATSRARSRAMSNDDEIQPYLIYRVVGSTFECAVWELEGGEKSLALFLTPEAAA